MEDQSKRSIKDRITPRIRSVATHATACAIGSVVVCACYKTRTRVTWCHITMENLDYLKENGQGVIGFGMDTKEKILFALPDIVK